jgi:hypothetical protein
MTGDFLLPFHLPAIEQTFVLHNSGDVTFSYFSQLLFQTEQKLKMEVRCLSKILVPSSTLEGFTSEMAILTLMDVATSFPKLYFSKQFLDFRIYPQ